MGLNVNRKNDRIIGSLEGKPFNIVFDQDKYEDLKMVVSRMEQSQSKETYLTMVEEAQSLIEVNFNEEVAAANGYLKFRVNSGTYHLVINKGEIGELVSDIPLPTALAERVVESYEEGADYMPLIMAWRRFLTRPKYHAEDANLFARYITSMFIDTKLVAELMEEGATEEAATELATFNDLAITTHGMLATYKVVDRVHKKYILVKDEDGNEHKKEVSMFPSTKTIDEVTGEVTTVKGAPKFLEELTFKPAIWSDGDKFFCGDKLSYMYKIGKEAVLPEDATRNYQNTGGGGGLYAGGLNYIKMYRSDTREVLTCFIDPSEIISFQAEGQAFRTNRMFINGIMDVEGDMEGMYFVSTYAKESNERTAERFKAAVEKSTEKAEKKQAKVDEKSAIVGELNGKKA